MLGHVALSDGPISDDSFDELSAPPMIINVNSGNPVAMGGTFNIDVTEIPLASAIKSIMINGSIPVNIEDWGSTSVNETFSPTWIQPLGGATSVNPDPVTFAIDATGGGTRYDASNDAELDLIPWSTLGPGDVVNVFRGVTPHNRKIGLRAQGTEANPVIINGVTDIAGNRPEFNFNNAVTCPLTRPGDSSDIFSATPEYGESLGGIVVRRGINGTYGADSPKYIEIRNLEVYGASNGNTYTTLDGATVAYNASAGIYFLLAEDCLVDNCVITDNGFGVFTQAKDDLFSEACKRLTFRSNRVHGNGISGSWFEHNFYLQCANPIVEGNYIGQTRAGSLGSSYKSRCSGEIFRYNYVEGSAFVCDWVHSEDQNIDGIVTQPDYGTDYVYGNTFANDYTLPNSGSGRMFHYGGDNLGEDDTGGFTNPASRYRNNMYFWGNTAVYRGTAVNNPWRASFFDLALATNNPNTSQGAPTTVNAWDNIFVMASSGALPNESIWTEWVGNLNLLGNNVSHGATMLDARSDATAGRHAVVNSGTLITGDPLFSDIANQEYLLSTGSSALGQRSNPAPMAAIIAAHPIEYQPNNKTNGLVPRASVTSLGAYE